MYENDSKKRRRNWLDGPEGLLRVLIYPIMFDRDPLAHVERVAEMIVRQSEATGFPPLQDSLSAVETALGRSENLSRLLPQPHSEDVIRRYLAAVAERLGIYIGNR